MLEEQQALSEARILLTEFTAVHIRPLIDGGMMGQVELVEHGFVKFKGKGREVRIFELKEPPAQCPVPGLPAPFRRPKNADIGVATPWNRQAMPAVSRLDLDILCSPTKAHLILGQDTSSIRGSSGGRRGRPRCRRP